MTSGGVSREAGGGSLTLESRPGHGTRLTVELPLLGPEIAAEFRLAVDRSLADAVAGEAERAGADVIVVPARRSWIPGSHGRWSRRVARRSGRPVHVAAAG